MTAPNGQETPAEVWGSTWIPGPSPVDGFGDATGYSIAWVWMVDVPMLQVLVDAASAPEPGARAPPLDLGRAPEPAQH